MEDYGFVNAGGVYNITPSELEDCSGGLFTFDIGDWERENKEISRSQHISKGISFFGSYSVRSYRICDLYKKFPSHKSVLISDFDEVYIVNGCNDRGQKCALGDYSFEYDTGICNPSYGACSHKVRFYENPLCISLEGCQQYRYSISDIKVCYSCDDVGDLLCLNKSGFSYINLDNEGELRSVCKKDREVPVYKVAVDNFMKMGKCCKDRDVVPKVFPIVCIPLNNCPPRTVLKKVSCGNFSWERRGRSRFFALCNMDEDFGGSLAKYYGERLAANNGLVYEVCPVCCELVVYSIL